MEIISLGYWLAGLFGKTPAAAVARKIGMAFAVVAGVIVLALLVWGGKAMYDSGIVSVYQDKRDAVVANATVVADREALANALDRANVSEAENDALENAMVEAKANDPAKGQSEVGPVQQSYFDTLPKKRK